MIICYILCVFLEFRRILATIQGRQPDSRYQQVAEGNPGSILQEDQW